MRPGLRAAAAMGAPRGRLAGQMSVPAARRRALVLCPSGSGLVAGRVAAAGFETERLVDAAALAGRLSAGPVVDVVVVDDASGRLDVASLARLVRDRTSGASGLLALTDGTDDAVGAALVAGAEDALPGDPSEVLLEARLAAVVRTVELRREASKLALEARIDPVTGLANRRALDEELARVEGRMRRYGERWCLVLVDLDQFKNLNDAWGHAAGDELLRTFGRLLVANTRVVDLAFRYGGDEFLLLLAVSAERTPEHAARRLRRALADAELAHPANDPWARVTMSAGYAVRSGTDGIRGWIEDADRALYEAKRQGRNRIVAAQPLGARYGT